MDAPLYIGPMGLKCLPCLDGSTLAAARRCELDISRPRATELGRSAVNAAADGHYSLSDGTRVDWSKAVAKAVASKVSIPPDAALPSEGKPPFTESVASVANETTLAAALKLVETGARPLALNMASGIHPGGGFLNGARAQEESICRSSALHATLVGDPMYAHHAARGDAASTDWMILSPDVPVFRNDSGEALATPWLCSFITCAAPYAPTTGPKRSVKLLKARIHRLLAVAGAYGFDTLVLGAWGCGAFHNDPGQTAADFREALEGPFEGRFRKVVFAITDWSDERRFLGPFRNLFSSAEESP